MTQPDRQTGIPQDPAAPPERTAVTGDELALLDTPLPISMMVWAGPGDEAAV